MFIYIYPITSHKSRGAFFLFEIVIMIQDPDFDSAFYFPNQNHDSESDESKGRRDFYTNQNGGNAADAKCGKSNWW